MSKDNLLDDITSLIISGALNNNWERICNLILGIEEQDEQEIVITNITKSKLLDKWTYIERYNFGTLNEHLFYDYSPCLKLVKWLNLDARIETLEQMKGLANNPYLINVSVITMTDNHLDAEVIIEFVKSPYLKSLHYLDLSRNDINDEGIEALVRAKSMGLLRELSLRENRFTEDSMKALAESPYMSNLKKLILSRTYMGDDALIELAKSKHLGKLEYLDISNCSIDDEGVIALAESKTLASLAEIKLDCNDFTEEGKSALEAAGYRGEDGGRIWLIDR